MYFSASWGVPSKSFGSLYGREILFSIPYTTGQFSSAWPLTVITKSSGNSAKVLTSFEDERLDRGEELGTTSRILTAEIERTLAALDPEQRQVAEITETDYFRDLQRKAEASVNETLKGIDAQTTIAKDQAGVLGSAMANAKIDIVGPKGPVQGVDIDNPPPKGADPVVILDKNGKCTGANCGGVSNIVNDPDVKPNLPRWDATVRSAFAQRNRWGEPIHA